MNELQKQLFTLQDPSYLEFHSKLIPTIEKNRIIGIRTPALRSFAKDFKGTKEAKAFLKELPHHYYEENNLHMMLISAEKDYETCVREINRFLDRKSVCGKSTVFFPISTTGQRVIYRHPAYSKNINQNCMGRF